MFRNVAVVSLVLAGLTGCGGGDPLAYEDAMNLMRERTTDPVRTSFSAARGTDKPDSRVARGYQRLIDAHVIVCKSNPSMPSLCEPGPAGDALTVSGVSDLSLVAGRWVPSSIIRINRIGRNSATADVRMSFEPSPLFQEFEDALDAIQSPDANTILASRKQGKVVKVTFQHYDDGWHVESVE